MTLPRLIMFDMDDTLISSYRGEPKTVWERTLAPFEAELANVTVAAAAEAIFAAAQRFWSDSTRHREGRLDLARTRSEITHQGLSAAGIADRALSTAVSEAFQTLRDQEMTLFPDAHETLDSLRERGVLLALITNGQSKMQRPKIERFALEHRFEHIQIEEEFGIGKPEPQSYLNILETFDVAAADSWIVGDNLEWEVAAPQKLGIHAIWHDHKASGLPPDAPAVPDRIIRGLAEILPETTIAKTTA